MTAMQLIAIRFGIAALFFFLFFRKTILPVNLDEWKQGAILGSLLFLGFASQTIGLYFTTVSKSAFITSFMVVFAPLLQVLLERKAPVLGNLLGIAVVCLGLWILTAPGEGAFNLGDALTLFCAFVFGLYIVYLDIASRRVPAIRLTFLQIAVCAFLGWSVVIVSETPSVPGSPAALTALVYLTIFATIVTTLVQTRFQRDTTPTRAAVIFSVEPLFATVFAALLLGEVVGPAVVVGGSLIISGILVSELSELVPGLRSSVSVLRRGR